MHHPINVSGAIHFVNNFGSKMEKVRLQTLLGQPPAREFIQPLLDLQNEDGGFPSRPRRGSPSSVDSTLTALWQLNDIGRRESEESGRARGFLISLQNDDGSWDENPDLPDYDLPPWIQVGDLATSLYLTAYAAYWLGLSEPEQPAFRLAVAFLMGEQEQNGRIPSYLHANWIATSALLLAGEQAAAAAQKSLTYLESQPFSSWDSSQIAWAIDNLGTAGLTGSHPFIRRALSELAKRQSPDGSWASEDGSTYAAAATVSALKVFQHYQGLSELDE